jgi:hypothetical protein
VDRPPLPPRKLMSKIARLGASDGELGSGHAIKTAR